MEWKKGSIDGVLVKKLVKHIDERGFLCEIIRSDEAPEDYSPAMSYISFTEPEVSRGPHEHVKQTDFFAFVGPGNFKVKLWDNRQDSNTYGRVMTVYGGKDHPLTILIPPGIVHGYKNISRTERGMVINYPNRLYMGAGKKEKVDEIRHETDIESPFSIDMG